MPEVRTVVTFEDPMFNASERKDYFIKECCYGDDLAHALIEQLRSHGIQTATDPGKKKFGWVFDCRIGGVDYQFVIDHRPTDSSDSGVWVGRLEHKAGMLGAMFGARNRGIKPDAVSIFHMAISSLPHVSNVHWHLKKDFDAGLEQRGQLYPSA